MFFLHLCLIIRICTIWSPIACVKNVIISSRNTCAFWVAQPWEYPRTVIACLHVACVCDVSSLEGQRALIWLKTRFWRLCCSCLAVPCFISAELFCSFGVSYPCKRLFNRDKIDIGSVLEKKESFYYHTKHIWKKQNLTKWQPIPRIGTSPVRVP